jgi:acyl-coenzyme A thioesterase PaaI-like protein
MPAVLSSLTGSSCSESVLLIDPTFDIFWRKNAGSAFPYHFRGLPTKEARCTSSPTGDVAVWIDQFPHRARPGYARATLRDRRRVRNHLRSVHAVALVNLAELATGLALNYGLRADTRAILVGLSIEYHRKARGLLTAEAHAPLLESDEEREVTVRTEVRDATGDVVATAEARWKVGPRTR